MYSAHKQPLSMNPANACGRELPPGIHKQLEREFLPAITLLLYQSYVTGVASMSWKQALVNVILYELSKSYTANLTPFSLICMFCLVKSHVMQLCAKSSS